VTRYGGHTALQPIVLLGPPETGSAAAFESVLPSAVRYGNGIRE
jgi:hypothetical protein